MVRAQLLVVSAVPAMRGQTETQVLLGQTALVRLLAVQVVRAALERMEMQAILAMRVLARLLAA
jgi:hypothetical protein